jgi:hypothetical protein
MPPDQVNRALANRAENLFIATQAEADLVEAAHYDPAAFGELYRRYVVRVYRYLYSHVGAAETAEDGWVFAGVQGFGETLGSVPLSNSARFHRQ